MAMHFLHAVWPALHCTGLTNKSRHTPHWKWSSISAANRLRRFGKASMAYGLFCEEARAANGANQP